MYVCIFPLVCWAHYSLPSNLDSYTIKAPTQGAGRFRSKKRFGGFVQPSSQFSVIFFLPSPLPPVCLLWDAPRTALIKRVRKNEKKRNKEIEKMFKCRRKYLVYLLTIANASFWRLKFQSLIRVSERKISVTKAIYKIMSFQTSISFRRLKFHS